MIYLASPYTHPEKEIRQRRYEETRLAFADMLRKGQHVFSPIVMCHEAALVHGLPTDFAFWQSYNFDALGRCDELIVLQLPGWSESRGVAGEVARARDLCMLITHLSLQAVLTR